MWSIGVYSLLGFDVFGAYLLAKDGDCYFAPETNIHPQHFDEHHARPVSPHQVKMTRAIRGRAAMITGPGHTVYGHWLSDFLPKLYLLKAAGHDIRTLRFLLPSDTPGFGPAWLGLLGIPAENIIFFDPARETLMVEELLVPTILHNGTRTSVLMRDAAETLLSMVGEIPGPAETRRRLFVSRSRASQSRPLLNRERIEQIAAGFGLEIVHPESMSLTEQIRLFADASLLVGEYGSALHGSLFSRPGTTVCNLRGSLIHPGFIQSGLGHALGQPTGYVFGETDAASPDGRFTIAERDFEDCLSTLLGITGFEPANPGNKEPSVMSVNYTKTTSSPLIHGGVQYLDFLSVLSTHLNPRSYLEVGTNEGRSLAAFPCDVLCIDPDFIIEQSPLRKRKRQFYFQMTSDEFFRTNRVRDFFPDGPDICFLDGMHRFEFLLRDFINAEATCRRNSLILLHDCLPLNERMTQRANIRDESEDESTRYMWTGDVWRILPVLKQYRPDLRIRFLDCGPTGLVAVTNLDPASTVLPSLYNKIVDETMTLSLEEFGMQTLWDLYPTIDTVKLRAHPEDISAVFNID